VSIFVRSDAAQLAHLSELVDAGELRVDVSAHYPLEDLATVHSLGEAGELRGKVVLTPTRTGDGERDGDVGGRQ
jgi:NADPH:quinone reductase-like Zn-dependent oxidoreductase